MYRIQYVKQYIYLKVLIVICLAILLQISIRMYLLQLSHMAP